MNGSVRNKLSAVLCGMLYLTGASASYAQTVPSAADPSRSILQNQQKAPDFKAVEQAEPQQKAPPANAPQGSDQAFFTLKSVVFSGLTAYPEATLRRYYAADLGRSISVARLFEILNAIQQHYLDDGYALTRVGLPTQDIAAGTVTFQIVEGYAAEVALDGDMPLDNPVIADAAQQLATMKPLNTKTLERLLLVMNDLPGLNVSALLGPVQGPIPTIGGIRLTLKQSPEKTASYGLAFNNYGSRFSGPGQVVASARQANIFTNYDEVAGSISAAIPASEMRYAAVKYQMPVWGASGAILGLDIVSGRTEPGASLRDLDVKGESKSIKLSASYPVIRQRDETLKLLASFEARNAKTNLLGDRLYDDRLRVVGLGGTYNFSDGWAGLNAIEANFYKGFNVLGVRRTGSDDLSRAQGEPDFSKITASIGRIQGLPLGLDLMTIIQGQYAYNPLLASEEFGFGGGQIGRGYDPSEITGDNGLSGTFELRYNALAQAYNIAFQPYAFWDIGKVWNIDQGAKNKVSASSTGLGLRMATQTGWSGDLNFSVPLTRQADNPPKYANGESPRVLFSLSKSF